MNRAVKTTLQIVGASIAVLVLAIFGVFYSAFGGNAPIVDGAEPAPGVRILKDGVVSIGVIDAGNDKLLLIDAGNDASGKPLLAELARRKLTSDAVSAIFLTHGHPDHTAGVHLFPKADVYALEPDVALAEGRAGSHGPVTQLFSPHSNGTKITHPLHDGDAISVGDATVRVFGVPGHTAGSAAYLVRNVLFLGDSAGLKTSGKLAGAPWAFSDDSAQNHASLKALADRLRPEQIHIVAIAPAHTATGTFDPLAQYTP
ncbi:MAG TPA: MBL fold metallo-hydrolase [Polyangiaceae bacterium]|jgi:glyoxylase-like metal-dependent hydrolase (beta-lactamase superfamily II)|nr:MBL fold metallo-hydrolase [Polyangiaceae bacterium]